MSKISIYSDDVPERIFADEDMEGTGSNVILEEYLPPPLDETETDILLDVTLTAEEWDALADEEEALSNYENGKAFF